MFLSSGAANHVAPSSASFPAAPCSAKVNPRRTSGLDLHPKHTSVVIDNYLVSRVLRRIVGVIIPPRQLSQAKVFTRLARANIIADFGDDVACDGFSEQWKLAHGSAGPASCSGEFCCAFLRSYSRRYSAIKPYQKRASLTAHSSQSGKIPASRFAAIACWYAFSLVERQGEYVSFM